MTLTAPRVRRADRLAGRTRTDADTGGLKTECVEVRGRNLADVAAFHQEAYGHGRGPEHWTWEYEGTGPGRYVFAVMRDGEKIVATQAMIPIYLNVAGNRVLTGKSESTLLEPRYRGGVLFEEFYEFAVSHCTTRGMECIWGFTPAVSALLRFGFRVYEHVMAQATCFLSPREPRHTHGSQPPSAVKGPARRMLRALRYAYASPMVRARHIEHARLSVTDGLLQQTDLDRLYLRLRQTHPGLIHLELDRAYLKWRVHNHPFFRYRTYFVYEGDVLRGYAFVNAEDEDMAYLTDVTFESVQAGELLVSHIIKHMRAAKVRAVSYFGNTTGSLGRAVFALLRTFGFVVTKTPHMAFVLRNLSCSDERILLDPSNWHLSGLWTEGFRM